MNMTLKTKVVHNHKFFLRIFFLTQFDLCKCLKKFLWGGGGEKVSVGGGGGGVVDFLNIVSTPGLGLSRLRLFFLTQFDLWKCLKKFLWGGGGGGVVDFLNIVSTPGPGLSRLKLGLVRMVTRLA